MEQMTQFRLVELEAGEHLTREGDASENYVILIGEALVTATDEITGGSLASSASRSTSRWASWACCSSRSAPRRCAARTDLRGRL